MREILIDWFQFTIKFSDDYLRELKIVNCDDINKFLCDHIFVKLFGIDRSLITNEFSARNGYTRNFNYKHIQVMCSDTNPDMGFNVLLTGQGCRDFEDLGMPWATLFEFLFMFGDININRIDIAIDSVNTNDYTIDLLYSYLENKQVVSKFRSCMNINSFKIGNFESTGRNLQFGSKSSNIEITFYDKKNERLSAGYDVDVDTWFRCELRFRNENAKDIFFELINNFDLSFIFGILYNYIDFKDYGLDKNKSRWKTSQFWLDFVQNSNKYKFVTRKNEDSIEKSKDWLSRSCSRSELKVMLATMDSLDEKIDLYSKWVIANGIDRITDSDIRAINEYRIKKGLCPFTKNEIIDWLKDMTKRK